MSILDNMILLPKIVEQEIYRYIPTRERMWINKENYNLYHAQIYNLYNLSQPSIETYIRAIIRKDMSFVFKKLLDDNKNKWIRIYKFKYGKQVFNNYVHFLIYFCIEMSANKCKKLIYLSNTNIFNQKWHKNNKVKYNRWKI